MARFAGKVGYGLQIQSAPGVFKDSIVEYPYWGDVLRNTKQLDGDPKVNDDFNASNTISIVADEYANEHFFAIRYVEWAGTRWKVSNVEVQRPRLLLRLGGVYHGVTAPTPS